MKAYTNWTTRQGRVVLNERCTCGKLRTEHEDNHPVLAQGHGPCLLSGCKRFTFKSFVLQRRKKAA